MTETTQQPLTPAPVPQKKRALLPVIVFVLLLCALCGFVPFMLLFSSGGTPVITGADGQDYIQIGGDSSSTQKLLVMYIDQPIATASQNYSHGLLTTLINGQYVFGYEVKDQLARAADESSIKGVLLLINSPGGTVVGARAIADGVAAYKQKTGNPVFAYIQDMGASGGYWAAASADKIYAEQGSLVGSIGVLMGPFEYYDQLVQLGTVGTRGGIDIIYITGGQSKDFGNPTRKLTDDEMKVLQKGINAEYDVFVSYVAQRRGITQKSIKEDIKALIYGVADAQRYGLIDGVATYEDSLSKLASQAGISSNYKVVKVSTGSTSLLGSILSYFEKDAVTKAQSEINTKPARSCVLCDKELVLFGNPTDY